MPRPRKPPRLVLRKDRDGERRWIIRDGGSYRRTGCLEHQAADAARALAVHIGASRQPDTSQRRADQVSLADVLTLYGEARHRQVARPRALDGMLLRLNAFWGERTPSQIIGENCRAYVKARGATIAARRELETLRAAVRLYAKEYGLDVVPSFWLPENGAARECWLERREAASLLLAAMGFVRDARTARWTRHKGLKREHLGRFILLGLYTGTRHAAILGLQWLPNTTGGWIDLERGVLYRRAAAARRTKKRQPPTRIPPRLLAHLRRWHAADAGTGHVVRYAPAEARRRKDRMPGAGGMTRIEKAFRGARKAAGLSDDVTPHVLRHTRATWLMQAGVDLWEAAGSLGMTYEQLERTYGHHHPDFQRRAAEAY